MTPQAKNLAIATACGIVSRDQHGALYHTSDGYVRDCPDYCDDLNAMHDAEKVLTYEQRRVYCGKLFNLPAKECESNTFATAAQRAEAFLRTLNL
jgi:hypothetical protein